MDMVDRIQMASPLARCNPIVASPIFCPAWAMEFIENPANAAISERKAVMCESTHPYAGVEYV
jgi:hypothetical protein